RIWFVLVLLPINTQAKPIDVLGAGIVGGRAVPSIQGIGIIVGVKHPLNVGGAARAHAIHNMTIRRAEDFWAFPVVVLLVPFGAAVISPRPRKPRPIHLDAEDDD